MKNFPHQYNRLPKLRATLETIRDLNAQGVDSADDLLLGYELARRLIYRFRHLNYTSGSDTELAARVAARIPLEQQKNPSSQGAQTAAREMRRTLRYLGFLNAAYELSAVGEALLLTSAGSDEERILMQEGIGRIAVEDDAGNVSHPIRILFRVLDAVTLNSRKGMQVALEAADDSVAELNRVIRIAAFPDDKRIEALRQLGWTDAQQDNAIKILPSFAEQAGLITKDGSGRFILTEAGRRIIGQPPRVTPRRGIRPPRRSARRRSGSTGLTTEDPAEVGRSRRMAAIDRRVLTAEEQIAAAELLYDRTERHQALVRKVAEKCARGRFYEDAAAYDLLIELGLTAPVDLAEIKTISGDAAVQIRLAVGQLLYYEFFSIPDALAGRPVRKVMIVDGPVENDLAAFLQQNVIGLIEYVDDDFRGRNKRGEEICRDLFL